MAKASGYITIDGKGRWVARYRTPDGKDTRKILGYTPSAVLTTTLPVLNEAAAQEWLAEILAPWRDWTDDSDPTFGQAAIEFLADCRAKGRRGTTCEEYGRICRRVRNHLQQYGMSDEDRLHRRLSQISERMMTDLRGEGNGNQTKTVLAGIVRVARKKHKYTGPDFSEFFERAPVKRKLEIEVYTPAEVEQIASSAADPELSAIIRVAAYTGLRMSEIRALTWGDVDFAGEKITVRRRYTDTDGIQPPKNGKVRTVPMARQVAETLREQRVRSNDIHHPATLPTLVFGNGWILTGTDGEMVGGYPRTYDFIYSGYVEAIKKAGVRRLRWHDLRGVFASTMVQRFPLPTVQEWLGHASIQTTMKYVHHVPRHDDAAKISELLGSSDA